MKSPKLASSSAVRAHPRRPHRPPRLDARLLGRRHGDPGDPDPTAPPTASFELALSSDKLPVLTGDSATIEVTLTRAAGFDGAVTLAPAGLPPQATASFAPETIAAGQTRSTLTVVAPAGTPHSLPTAVTIRGTAGDKQVTKPLTVTIYGAPGSLDTSFGGGKVVVPAGAADDYANAMAVQPDGKLIVAGRAAEHLGDFAVVRLERDGTLDTTFGPALARQGADRLRGRRGDRLRRGRAARRQDRRRRHDDGDRQRPGLRARALQQRRQPRRQLRRRRQADDRVRRRLRHRVRAADPGRRQDRRRRRHQPGEQHDRRRLRARPLQHRRHPRRQLRPTAARSITSLAAFGGRDSIYALALQTVDGEARIVAAGGEGDFTVARYLPQRHARRHLRHRRHGKVTALFGSTIGAARAVRLTADGKIVLAGHASHDFALVRLTSDGQVDTGFGARRQGRDRRQTTNWDEAQGLAIEADGKIVVAGWVYEGNSSSGNFALVRYQVDGELDTTFGGTGMVITPVAAGHRPRPGDRRAAADRRARPDGARAGRRAGHGSDATATSPSRATGGNPARGLGPRASGFVREGEVGAGPRSGDATAP